MITKQKIVEILVSWGFDYTDVPEAVADQIMALLDDEEEREESPPENPPASP